VVKKNLQFKLHKVINWEYWPQWVVYTPIIPAYLWYALKSRALFFFNATNPTMENGGYLMESKYTIYKALPDYSIPTTILIEPNFTVATVKEILQASALTYPIICKPDIGGRGLGVELIRNEEELIRYHTVSPINYLIQQYISFTNEAGIFYCRMPNQPNGFISGIVGKINMEVTGDGKSTLADLILATPRFYYQRKYLFEKLQSDVLKVLQINEVYTLSTIGNHARGSEFIDMTHKITSELSLKIDDISKSYSGFYFGRYDIKFNSWEELCKGENFTIIELNGAGSEPTHIYDPSTSIFKAWKIILFHWKMSYNIAKINVTKGALVFSIKDGIRLIKQQKALNKRIHQAFYQ
jgi:hypothetical protein